MPRRATCGPMSKAASASTSATATTPPGTAALAALVQRSDVVLMDLRGFQAHNAGCVHELQTLAPTPRLGRVAVLVDDQTDRVAADAAAAAAPPGRFVWLAATLTGARARCEVLRSLFGAATPLAAEAVASLRSRPMN